MIAPLFFWFICHLVHSTYLVHSFLSKHALMLQTKHILIFPNLAITLDVSSETFLCWVRNQVSNYSYRVYEFLVSFKRTFVFSYCFRSFNRIKYKKNKWLNIDWEYRKSCLINTFFICPFDSSFVLLIDLPLGTSDVFSAQFLVQTCTWVIN